MIKIGKNLKIEDKSIYDPFILYTKTKKVAIVGSAKNIQSYVKRSIKKILKIGSFFDDYRIVIHENDSRDNTVSLLKQQAKLNDKITIITEKGIKGNRTQMLAHSRNTLLKTVNSMEFTPDYYIVMDLDDKSILSPHSVLTCFDHKFIKQDWVMCGGNNSGAYYDVWALRCSGWLTTDYTRLRNKSGIWKTITQDSKPIKVTSCFNGIGVYKYDLIRDCKYNGDVTCEHVSFHKSILAKNRKHTMYINPKMLVAKVSKGSFIKSVI